MNLVTIERKAADGLSHEAWRFNFYDADLVLWFYAEWQRPTTKHKTPIEPIRVYDRDRPAEWERLAREGQGWLPPMPEDVVAEARQKFVKQITTARIVAPTQADIDRIRETGR